MLPHQLGQDLILVLELGLQYLDLLVLGHILAGTGGPRVKHDNPVSSTPLFGPNRHSSDVVLGS